MSGHGIRPGLYGDARPGERICIRATPAGLLIPVKMGHNNTREVMGILDEIGPSPPWLEGKKPRKALVALSGGVDSAFAALAIKRTGVPLAAVHFDLGELKPGKGKSPDRDRVDAERVAKCLGIEFTAVPIEERLYREVVTPFAQKYAQGLTPNPCVTCNPMVKWKTLIETAQRIGADLVATGHYARVTRDSAGRPRLLRGLDGKKDQSYFLSRLRPEQLARAALPAGWFEKDRVRDACREAGLFVSDKEESQDVCFIKDGYMEIVEKALGRSVPPPGDIVDLEGKSVGSHMGVHGFTIGQRKGLSLPGPDPSYVVDIDPEARRVVVGKWEDLFHKRAVVQEMNWLSSPPGEEEKVAVKIRYRAPLAAARVSLIGEDEVEIIFDEPQRAITPGQTAVIYRGDEALGGGSIGRPVPGERG